MAELCDGAAVEITAVTAAELEAWNTLISVTDRGQTASYVLIGGQMVALHTSFAGVRKPSATDDMDVLVDLRVLPEGLAAIVMHLETLGYAAQSLDADGIQHRWVKEITDGPVLSQVTFDVLAPDNLGPRARLITSGSGRTVQTPGGSFAIDTAISVVVKIETSRGLMKSAEIRLPSLAGALVLKSRATLIAGRAVDRDFEDAAALLTCIDDPVAFASGLRASQRRHLHLLQPLQNASHAAWRAFGAADVRNGVTALGFLLPS